MAAPLVRHFPVTTLASGQELAITAHEVDSGRSGPTVSIISGSHGDEFFTAEFCRHVIKQLAGERERLRGRVILVPMASPLSFDTGTRATVQDAGNMNRVFPGNLRGTLTEQMTAVLVKEVVRGSDLVLDYHAEPDSMNIRCTYARAADSPYGRQALDAAIASGSPVIYASGPNKGSLSGCAEDLGILALTPELGGPFPDEAYHLDYGWTELRNLLQHIGSLPGEPPPPGDQHIVHNVAHVRPQAGGLFYPEVGFDALTRVLPRDTVLGRVLSPYTFAELDVLRAPFERNVMMVVRGRLSRVHPGDPAYIIGEVA